MQLIRGTTPTIIIDVKSEIDLHQVVAIWVYISQQNKVKVDKELSDVTFDYENRKITVLLSQEDTLNLRAGDAIFQIRLLLSDDTALATLENRVTVKEVYKGGVITEETEEEAEVNG